MLKGIDSLEKVWGQKLFVNFYSKCHLGKDLWYCSFQHLIIRHFVHTPYCVKLSTYLFLAAPFIFFLVNFNIKINQFPAANMCWQYHSSFDYFTSFCYLKMVVVMRMINQMWKWKLLLLSRILRDFDDAIFPFFTCQINYTIICVKN